jgi:S-(hydroxymethyl)glutathione dehydrogenase/alcohol dehydrogenase
MIRTTQAAVLEQTGADLRILDLQIPDLLPWQVLVEVRYSGMCRSQLMEARGMRGEDPWLPHLLGHEASGIVLGVGEGVTKIQEGDEVILTWIKGEGMDVPGGLFTDGERQINSGPVTTFSRHTVVSENRVVAKPASLPFDTAILYGCALPTGAGMVINELDIEKHNSVVVYGLGGIGITALLALLARKIKTVIAIDVSED